MVLPAPSLTSHSRRSARGERSHPSPFELPNAELHALEDLSGEIATLAQPIHQATHRLLTLVAEFDRRRGWELGGHATCAHWLAWRTGIDLGSARERVRAARALADLPVISAAMAEGELSFSKVRALTRVASADDEVELLELAKTSTAHQVERMVRGWKRGNRMDEVELERRRHQSRCFSVFPGDDGMYVVKGRLKPEEAALLLRALEAAADALYWQGPDLAEEEQPTPEQRRADALCFLAERALAAGLDQEGGGPDAPVSGTRAERFQVVLHVDADTLSADPEPGLSELEDGSRVAAATSGRLSCDSSLVVATRNAEGKLLDVGRRTRTVPPAIRRALEIRDRGCRFPGCGRRFTDAHHIQHWAQGGHTRLDNLILLCRVHHRLLHEGGFRVQMEPDRRAVFYDPRGVPLPNVPPLKRSTREEVECMKRTLGIRGFAPR